MNSVPVSPKADSIVMMGEIAEGRLASLVTRLARLADALGGTIPEKASEPHPSGSHQATLERVHIRLGTAEDLLQRIETIVGKEQISAGCGMAESAPVQLGRSR